jgi:hypothetical protein
VTNYCTVSACAGVCQVGTSSGTCDVAPRGTNPKAMCGGSTSCMNLMCSGQCMNTSQMLNACDGASASSCANLTQPCTGSLTCLDVTNCRTSCSGDGHCTTGYYCSSNTCQAKKAVNAGCTRDGECSTNVCVNSVCQVCGGTLGGALCDSTSALCSSNSCSPCGMGANGNTQCTSAGWGDACASGNCTCSGNAACKNPRALRCDATNGCTCGSGTICPLGQLCTGSTTTSMCKQNADQPCQANSDCISGNCTTSGTCAKNTTGQPCLRASDCTSSTCTGYVCG